ncbi:MULTISPECIES: DEAD/DEAH box helicase [Muribaculaceae]|mgnify:CR=1 FL=1|jgi:superfamily II DNA or RNA helicase|uniref:DEAD/DEAH box helicase n=2 Tax=Bacteroidales TaxID=171549 RepID=UPI00244DED96|nr:MULTISPECIES: DEAD/DEAH box helicase [Muribaculaceae]
MDISEIELNDNGLRMHQIDAKRKIFTAWRSCDSVMLQMPTGTGKTYLFTSVIKDLLRVYKQAREEINILVVAHRMELLDQISATLSRFDIPHGFIQGTREQHLWRRVQVGSIMSLLTEKNYMNTRRQQFDFIIVDEAHHSLAETYVKLFELFPKAKKLGVTATPWRLNHESFRKLYQILVTSPQISWFIKNRLLSDFEYVSIKPDSEIQRLVDRSEVAQNGDFVNADLDNTFNNTRIRAKLFESYQRFAKGRKGIIYAINRIHAARIAALYSANGVKAVAIDCETPKEERQELIARFKRGEIMVLVNVDIFTEGFDCPDVSFIQLARPTKSLALYLQQVGRGLRISEGKEKTVILDNVGLFNYFGLPDANRKWQYHFHGLENVESENGRKRNKDLAYSGVSNCEFDEFRLKEDDEMMMVVRSLIAVEPESQTVAIAEDVAHVSKVPPVEEFTVADYYLVRGNKLRFKIYTLTKKRGKITTGISACIYEYDSANKPIVLWNDTNRNAAMLKDDIKLETIISFAAMMLKINLSDVFQYKKLAERIGMDAGESVSLYELLKILSMLSV